MSPRLLIPLCLLCATTGFGVIRLLPGNTHNTDKPTTLEAPFSKTGNATAKSKPLQPEQASADTSAPTKAALPTLKELMDSILEKGESPADSRLAFIEAIGKLRSEQLVEMLSKEAENPGFYRHHRFEFQFAAMRLSEIAPAKAADLWMKNRSLRFHSGALLDPWIKKDPQAFLTWNATLPAEVQKATASAFTSLATESPEQFASITSQVTDIPGGPQGARGAIRSMFPKGDDKGDTTKAINYAQALPQGALRNAALAEMATWPGLDLGAHPEITSAIAALPADEAAKLGRNLAKNAELLPAGASRETAFTTSIRKQAQKDPAAAAAKLDKLASSPDYPAAVRGFVEATASKDPAAAAEWALSVNSNTPQARMATLEKVAATWFQQNPTEARAWVEKAPLTDQEYFRLTGRQKFR